MKFKANVQNTAPMSPREEVEMKYKRSRANLLLVIIVSVVNLFTLALNGSYFLFSASIPAIPVELAMPMSEEEVVVFSDFIIPIIIGIILTVPYLLCWVFSKKRAGWMIPALVFFSFDCLYLFLLATIDPTAVIIDILFHAWVMFYLITGVINGFKLKKMPEEEPLPEFGAESDAPAEDGFNTFNEADFTYEAPKTKDSEDKGDAFVAKEDKE
jgi:hypothetical protein